jgi:hypothetical protein
MELGLNNLNTQLKSIAGVMRLLKKATLGVLEDEEASQS